MGKTKTYQITVEKMTLEELQQEYKQLYVAEHRQVFTTPVESYRRAHKLYKGHKHLVVASYRNWSLAHRMKELASEMHRRILRGDR